MEEEVRGKEEEFEEGRKRLRRETWTKVESQEERRNLSRVSQGSGNIIFTNWASRLPLRMEVAFGHLKSYLPNLKGFHVKTTQFFFFFFQLESGSEWQSYFLFTKFSRLPFLASRLPLRFSGPWLV